MPSSQQRKLPLQAARPAYRTLQGWALGTLIEQGAVVECEHHGHHRDRGDPHAWKVPAAVGANFLRAADALNTGRHGGPHQLGQNLSATFFFA
jgi:hypothetical protein